MSRTLVSRRDFIRRSLAGGAALAAGPFILPASAIGANERIGIAVIGPGRQGGNRMIVIMGARNKSLLILENEMRALDARAEGC
ncbi:MAG: twin-arginine translocation signal domain-containing protein [Kiritimatiellaeota bacterium]|nr:twin-arginine translocation signal domain-containing protein [Kiritimatiellota bacterium]